MSDPTIRTANVEHRVRSAAEWISVNPILRNGEIGLEEDTLRMKAGDGVNQWANLPYFNPGLTTRRTETVTITVAPAATAEASITLGPGISIMAVETDKESWIRLYESVAARAADAARDRADDPSPGAGVVLEAITTSGDLALTLSPPATAFNQENPVTAAYPLRVTNDAGTADVEVSLTIVEIEKA